MLNRVMIIGRLGRDPELRYTQSGSPVASLRIATDESYTDKDGNRMERTEWHSVVVFQRAAENCNQYLRKGSLVFKFDEVQLFTFVSCFPYLRRQIQRNIVKTDVKESTTCIFF